MFMGLDTALSCASREILTAPVAPNGKNLSTDSDAVKRMKECRHSNNSVEDDCAFHISCSKVQGKLENPLKHFCLYIRISLK